MKIGGRQEIKRVRRELKAAERDLESGGRAAAEEGEGKGGELNWSRQHFRNHLKPFTHSHLTAFIEVMCISRGTIMVLVVV